MNRRLFSGQEGLTRREFVKSTAAAAAALGLMSRPGDARGDSRYPYWGKVVAARDDSATDGPRVNARVVASLLDEAVQALTDGRGWEGIFPDVRPADRVAIKINAFRTGTLITHEEVLEGIAARLVELGIKPGHIVIFDGDSSASKISSLAMASVKSRGVKVLNTGNYALIASEGFDRNAAAAFAEGGAACLTRIITESNYLINVPVLKDHGVGGITFSLKNHVGSVDSPNLIHRNLTSFSTLSRARWRVRCERKRTR